MDKTAKTNDWQERECGALWKRTSPNQTYLSGHVEVDELGSKKKVKVVVFSNKNKNKDTQPDYRVYLSRPATPVTSEEVVATSNESDSEDIL